VLQPLICESGQNYWHPNGGGTQHYNDGIADEVVPQDSRVHTFEGTMVGTATTQEIMGRSPGGPIRMWKGLFGTQVNLSASPTAAQRTNYTRVFKEFYGYR
jgi:hypothetical protein